MARTNWFDVIEATIKANESKEYEGKPFYADPNEKPAPKVEYDYDRRTKRVLKRVDVHGGLKFCAICNRTDTAHLHYTLLAHRNN